MRILWLLAFFLSGFELFAQDFLVHFDNRSRENGLAQSTVYGVVQGGDGFMWLSTAEGLHRFDGYDFKIFKHDVKDSNSLSENHTTAVFEDSENRLWIGTHSGVLNMFDRKSETFSKIKLKVGASEENRYSITAIHELDSGKLVVGLDGGGLVQVNLRTKTQKLLTVENSDLPNNYITCIKPERNELGLWVGTQQGMILYQKSGFKTFSSLSLFNNQYVSDILHLGKKVYITTFGQGLQIWDINKDELLAIPSPRKIRASKFMNFILDDGHGSLWIGTNGGGILKYDGENFVNYRHNPFDKRSLVSDHVLCAYKNEDNVLWFGCSKGLSSYAPNRKLFDLYTYFEHNGKTINNNMYCMHETRDKMVWMGTLSGGLIRFDPSNSETKVFPLIKDGNIEARSVRALHEDRNGVLWIGTRGEGLFSLDRSTNTFKHHPTGEKIRLNTIRDILEDKDGTLWLATKWGLVRFQSESGDFKVFQSPYLQNNKIYEIHEDRERNELYLVTFRNGLHLFHKDKEAFTVMTHNEDARSPSVNSLMCMLPIGNDSFLIGSYGGGLNIFDRKKLEFSTISTSNGLPNDVVYGIIREDKEHFWLSTNDGLVRMNLPKLNFQRFDLDYYLQDLEYNEGAFLKSSDGTFYFGGPNGFNKFKPGLIKPKNNQPLTVLTGFTKMDQDILKEENLTYSDRVEVEYNANLINFKFAAFNYSNPTSTRYSYKLEGYDNDWIYSGTRRNIFYTRLSPGEYALKVKCHAGDGQWTEPSTLLQVVVKPPFWLTWWFITLAILALIGLIVWIIQQRTKRISKNYKHRLVELELRALRSQMNPHFIFNSLNSIQYFVLKNEPKQAYTYLAKFSSLMRMILQNSRKKFISLQAEENWLDTYLELEKLRMEGQLDYQISVDQFLDKEEILVPSMLVQPYVENSIVHGLLPLETERKLNINFQKVGEGILVTIEDNGIGRGKSAELNAKRRKKHKSQGIKLTEERLELLGYEQKGEPKFKIIDLEENNVAKGTRVEIRLPILTKEELESS